MKNLLLLLVLSLAALPASAEPFAYVSFEELRAANVDAEVRAAKRMMIILSLFLGDDDATGYALKDEPVGLIFVRDDVTKDLIERLPFLKDLAKNGTLIVPAAEILTRFHETQEAFCGALASISKQDPKHKALPTMAGWGRDTWVKTDPAIDLHSEPILSRARYDALKLK